MIRKINRYSDDVEKELTACLSAPGSQILSINPLFRVLHYRWPWRDNIQGQFRIALAFWVLKPIHRYWVWGVALKSTTATTTTGSVFFFVVERIFGGSHQLCGSWNNISFLKFHQYLFSRTIAMGNILTRYYVVVVVATVLPVLLQLWTSRGQIPRRYKLDSNSFAAKPRWRGRRGNLTSFVGCIWWLHGTSAFTFSQSPDSS